MFPKKHRLAKTTAVQSTLRRGRSFFNSYCTVKFIAHPSPPRFTIIVSTRISKKAVIRNRLKRILREAVRPYVSDCRAGDYVIIARPPAAAAPPADLRQALLKLLRSVHLLVSHD